LANIENALENMRQGTYGDCESCGGSIPLARLQALPYATLCIHCQREAEKSGMPRGTTDWSRLIDTSPVDNDAVFSDIELDVP
jgi:DnaK suppressor protein